MIAFLGLFFYTPEYELLKSILHYRIPVSILMLIIIVIGVITFASHMILYIIKLKTRIKTSNRDREILNEIKKLLPLNYAKDFLGQFDFGSGKFSYEKLETLEKFIDIEENPEFHFLDKKLDIEKQELLEVAKRLKRLFIEHFDRIPGDKDEWRMSKNLKERDRQLYEKAIEEVNQTSSEMWEKYKKLISFSNL